MKNSTQSLASDESKMLTVLNGKLLHFPEGLPAFENIKDFVLIAKEEELPFFWLQSVQQPGLAFIVIDPFLIHPSYRPEVMDEEMINLAVSSPEEVMLLSIVNMKKAEDTPMTANLLGPIVVNWEKKLAKQVILKNHMDYSVKHPIEPSN